MGQLLTRTYTIQISWLMCSWSTFGAHTSHRQTWIHKTHNGLDLGEATTFPFIAFSMFGHGACTQMPFCFRTPKLRVSKFPKVGLLQLWRPITFVKTSNWDEVWSKVITLIKSFPMVCGTPPTHKWIKAIIDF